MKQLSEVIDEISQDLQECQHGRLHPETKDQKLYGVGKRHFKAFIDGYLTHEVPEHPSILACRHAALQLNNEGQGYVIYDRLLNRIVDGVYGGEGALDAALAVAQAYNDDPSCSQDMSPNGLALGLHYPVPHKQDRDEE